MLEWLKSRTDLKLCVIFIRIFRLVVGCLKNFDYEKFVVIPY